MVSKRPWALSILVTSCCVCSAVVAGEEDGGDVVMEEWSECRVKWLRDME